MNVVMTCIRKEHHLVWLHDTCLMHNHVEKPLSKDCPKGHAKFSDHCLDNIDFCKFREILTVTKNTTPECNSVAAKQNLYATKKRFTLNVIMLKRDTFPPDADMTYESFLERAMQGTASSTLVSLMSLVIRIPLGGCHN
jgi:negative regulator of genetic competence, sporulation and motility